MLSKSLIVDSTLVSLGISVRIVGIPIFVGIIASIPYVKANGDSPVSFRLVVL